jgi:hypothetical protein
VTEVELDKYMESLPVEVEELSDEDLAEIAEGKAAFSRAGTW